MLRKAILAKTSRCPTELNASDRRWGCPKSSLRPDPGLPFWVPGYVPQRRSLENPIWGRTCFGESEVFRDGDEDFCSYSSIEAMGVAGRSSSKLSACSLSVARNIVTRGPKRCICVGTKALRNSPDYAARYPWLGLDVISKGSRMSSRN